MPSAVASAIEKATWISLSCGALLSGIWLWCNWCSFPAIPWNDIRVAPAVALHKGISIYSTANSGPVSTWIYGPVALLVMWPAGLASTALGAVQVAGAIHIGLRVFTLVLTCWLWPAATAPASRLQRRQCRLAVAMICVLLIRNQTSGYMVYSADAPAIALGLVALLALVREHPWLATVCAIAAAACKQTLLGVGLAQAVWLFLTVSPRAAINHLGRLLLAGAFAAILAVGFFGWAGLWHTMIEVPSSFPWAAIPERINTHLIYIILHVLLPSTVMVVWHRFFLSRRSPILLPCLAFFCTLPLSLAGFLKIGGNVNSLHGFWLWFPPTLITLTTGATFGRLSRSGNLVLAVGVVALASLWLQISRLPALPNTQAYREATYLAARMPEKIWFPLHPLITLYSDGRFYHDLDGLCERTLAGERLNDAHFFAHMPPQRRVSATLLPVGWGLADIAEGRLPPNAPVGTFGLWRLDGSVE